MHLLPKGSKLITPEHIITAKEKFIVPVFFNTSITEDMKQSVLAKNHYVWVFYIPNIVINFALGKMAY